MFALKRDAGAAASFLDLRHAALATVVFGAPKSRECRSVWMAETQSLPAYISIPSLRVGGVPGDGDRYMWRGRVCAPADASTPRPEHWQWILGRLDFFALASSLSMITASCYRPAMILHGEAHNPVCLLAIHIKAVEGVPCHSPLYSTIPEGELYFGSIILSSSVV